MQEKQVDQIYGAVLKFCNESGLNSKLKNSLARSENERFDSLNIDDAGLDVLDAVHCLIDKQRTNLLIEELKRKITNSDSVIEAGIGTGILSFVASVYAREVVGFEINPKIFMLANDIKKYLIGLGLIEDNIKFILGDARLAQVNIKADVLISENLYTGMFFEKQVQITRSLVNFLKPGAILIPDGMRSYFNLTHVSLPNVKQIELRVVSDINEVPVLLSDICEYDTIRFCNTVKDEISYSGNVRVKKGGVINSILISSDVLLSDNKIISRYDTIFMNNDILLLVPENIEVREGDVLSVRISYSYGSNPKDSVIEIKRL